MAIALTTVPGSLMVQKELPYGNVIFNDQEGVVYSPNPLEVLEQDAYFYYTCAPPTPSNFSWNRVNFSWTRNYIDEVPLVFKVLFTLEGILLDGSTHLIGEKVVDTITDTPQTESVTFELKSSRASPSLLKTGIGKAPSGKIKLNLPKRMINFEDIKLKRTWLENWSKRKTIPVTGNSSEEVITPVLRSLIVQYDSDMKSDFSDIRFTDKDGQSFLCYDREYYSEGNKAVFNVLLPDVGVNELRNIYMYYGNSSADYNGNSWNVFESPGSYDDFEDGKYTGRSSPYHKWSVLSGSPGIESTSPISGNYSLKHTGNGTDNANNLCYRAHTPYPKVVSFDFRVTNQGTIEQAPYLHLWFVSYYNNQNYLKIDTYYNSGQNKQKLRLVKAQGGNVGLYAESDWLNGKLATGVTHSCIVIDTGTNVILYIDGVLIFNSPYSISYSRNYEGMGANLNCSGLWDNIRTSPYKIYGGTVGSEQSPVTINPDSYTEDDTTIFFTIPSDHVNNNPYCIESVELHHSSFVTGDVLVNNQDELFLSYNNTDIYQALRVGVYIKADKNCSIRFNSPLSYAYEVI